MTASILTSVTPLGNAGGPYDRMSLRNTGMWNSDCRWEEQGSCDRKWEEQGSCDHKWEEQGSCDMSGYETGITVVGSTHLDDSTEPAGVANILEPDGGVSSPASLMGVEGIHKDREEGQTQAGQAGLVLSYGGLQSPKEGGRGKEGRDVRGWAHLYSSHDI